MNSYYVEFHARDSVDRWHGEAEAMRRLNGAGEAERFSGRVRNRWASARTAAGASPKQRAGRLVFLVVIAAALLGLFRALPAAASGADSERIVNVDSVVAVAFPENFPIASLMRADCAFVRRVEKPDGSAQEVLVCTLSDEPVLVPEFQGQAPKVALNYGGGSCEWVSEFWYAKNETIVYAESYRVVVTPAGKVHASSTYPANPLDCG
jgi:hypothetical protein